MLIFQLSSEEAKTNGGTLGCAQAESKYPSKLDKSFIWLAGQISLSVARSTAQLCTLSSKQTVRVA